MTPPNIPRIESPADTLFTPGFVKQQIRDAKSTMHNRKALVWMGVLVRAGAAKLLGGFTDPTVRPKLEPLLEDKSDAVRYMAAAAIVRIERKSRR